MTQTEVLGEAIDRGARDGRRAGENYNGRTHPADRTRLDVPDPAFEAIEDLCERDMPDELIDLIIESYQKAYLAGWFASADCED